MFSLENELQKRLDIVAEEDALIAKREALEIELAQVNEDLAKYDYEEIRNEIAEIKTLMGLDEPEAETEENTEEVEETENAENAENIVEE